MLPIFTLFAVTACGRKGARSSDFDSATAAALATGTAAAPVVPVTRNPHVVGFELAHRLDQHNLAFGGPTTDFAPGDSILLSVRTIYVDSGSSVSARLRQNKRTIDSVGTTTGVKDSAGMSAVGLRFGHGKPLDKGTYQADVFLNGTFQVSQEFRIVP